MREVHVDKADLTKTHIAERVPGDLADGGVRLAVESFSVTANNVTYAVVGDGFGYWNFFPANDGHGIVPMWGHARVIESRHPDFAEGERVYGYLPMATQLDVLPGKVSASGFTDLAEHRQPMSPIYNQYSRLAADPEHDPAREGERMIFGPLFKTGFLIEYFMRSEEWFGARQVILTSASSKTAMGLASVAKRRSPDVTRIGLTSSGNVGFVEDSGLYDRVLSYDEIGSVEGVASVSVDFAGNARVLRGLHEHLGEHLKYSCLVGATHIEARGQGTADLPGPTPTLFFAPDHAVALFKEVGPEKAGAQMAESWHGFLEDAGDSVTIERRQGIEAARDTFVAMLGGNIDPAKGIVIEP
ncbi:DUF2855 family protein [Qipengyuania sp. XHP0207]|uniref:DUF2855 family protein n=1 Tax=Qipengyuania sp. XHP0207 TaxID=3038078 RepID=UPI00241F46D3|nr:DUF2855 family protein [Qipengyuania sp. XHP0207]MDG5747360.1 DUF2855 family protein [Qipengyuania sp. XHP0207]